MTKTHLKLYKNIHTYVASSTPFSLNVYNFADFTNSNKSFLHRHFRKHTLWENVKKKIDFSKPDHQNTSLHVKMFKTAGKSRKKDNNWFNSHLFNKTVPYQSYKRRLHCMLYSASNNTRTMSSYNQSGQCTLTCVHSWKINNVKICCSRNYSNSW